jgi:MoxR-like ATPase
MDVWESASEAGAALKRAGYLADVPIAQVVFLADRLEKPILAEGPAGVGKTALALALAEATGRKLVRLQCYEGLDEAKALYEWNYHKQLLRIQTDEGKSWNELEGDIFAEEFLLTRPLLEAITSPEPVVLLIDEVDRVEMETEALLLEVLDAFQVSIPELGTISGSSRPLVVLTSNNTAHRSGGQIHQADTVAEGPVGIRVDRLGANLAGLGDRRGRCERDHRNDERAPEVPVRHRQGGR